MTTKLLKKAIDKILDQYAQTNGYNSYEQLLQSIPKEKRNHIDTIIRSSIVLKSA
jgi:iron uptake system EfeUOB component EfeO/EfeM